MKNLLAIVTSLATACAGVVTLAPSVAHADEPPAGHLTLDVRCADGRWDGIHGLHVEVDGAAQKTTGIDSEGGVFTDADGNLQYGYTNLGVGFHAPAGEHVVRISSDECDPIGGPIVIREDGTTIEATLPIADPSLRTPTGAPNGFYFEVGGYQTTLPKKITADVTPALGGNTFSLGGAPTLKGLYLAGGYVARDWIVGGETAIGFGSAPFLSTDENGNATSFDAHLLGMSSSARAGLRLSLGSFALSGGLGLGLSTWIARPGSMEATSKSTYEIPFWAGATWKPTCDVGVQLGAEYRWAPEGLAQSTKSVNLGLLFEPNGACSREPSFASR